jgi:hypothetical protein
MTPKEKAMELVDKFYQTTPNESWINQPIGLKKEYKAWEQSKQCALIAVDEIINICPFIGIDFAKSEGAKESDAKEYWQEVKQEINQINN